MVVVDDEDYDFFKIDDEYTPEEKRKRKEQEDKRVLERMDLSTIEKFLRQKKLNNLNKNI